MAKSGFWLNGAKGKLAGATIYTSDGETVMRQIKGSIKNPKTKAQMIQRVIAKTTMSQYAFMKGICDHSFQGLTAGKKCMAKFASLNNKLLRTRAKEAQDAGQTLAEVFNYIPCKSAKYVPASVIISEGELPRIYTTNDGSVASVSMEDAANTYEGIAAKLGLQRGDQLTFVTVEKNEIGNYSFNVCRVILDPRNEDGTAAPMSTAFVEGNAIVKPSFRNEGNFDELTYDSGASVLKFNIGANDIAAAGVIASREEDGDWKRSTCVLVTSDSIIGDDLCSLEDAVRISVEGTPIYTDSSRYLNNAGVGGPQSEDAPESFGVVINDAATSSVVKGGTINVYSTSSVHMIEIRGAQSGMNVKAEYRTAMDEPTETEFGEEGGVYYTDEIEGVTPIVVKGDGTTLFTIVHN